MREREREKREKERGREKRERKDESNGTSGSLYTGAVEFEASSSHTRTFVLCLCSSVSAIVGSGSSKAESQCEESSGRIREGRINSTWLNSPTQLSSYWKSSRERERERERKLFVAYIWIDIHWDFCVVMCVLFTRSRSHFAFLRPLGVKQHRHGHRAENWKLHKWRVKTSLWRRMKEQKEREKGRENSFSQFAWWKAKSFVLTKRAREWGKWSQSIGVKWEYWA